MRAMTTLEGRRWRLVAWRAADGSREAVPPDVEATALFEDGALTGRGGCNGLRASYELAGPRLAIGPVASTMMACAEPAMRVESGYHAGLARVAAMRVTEDSLAGDRDQQWPRRRREPRRGHRGHGHVRRGWPGRGLGRVQSVHGWLPGR